MYYGSNGALKLFKFYYPQTAKDAIQIVEKMSDSAKPVVKNEATAPSAETPVVDKPAPKEIDIVKEMTDEKFSIPEDFAKPFDGKQEGIVVKRRGRPPRKES